MNQEEFDKLLGLFKIFVKDTTLTDNINSNSLNDFLGWLKFNYSLK